MKQAGICRLTYHLGEDRSLAFKGEDVNFYHAGFIGPTAVLCLEKIFHAGRNGA